MSTKPSEQFHETLLTQYKELIHEKMIESDHKLEFDHELFEKLLYQVMKAAKVDGLSPEEVLGLIEIAKREIPSHCKAT